MSDDVAPRDRRSRRAGPGLASALLGGGLLIALGFGLGVVAGLLLEEPDLILDYAAGRTQDVTLEGTAGAGGFETFAAPLPDVAAKPPLEPGATRPATTPQGVEEASSVAARDAFDAAGARSGSAATDAVPEPFGDSAAPGPAPSGGFAVQVGAFADASAAEQLASRLRAAGLPVYVAPSVDGDAERWRVRVGPTASREEAEQLARRLEHEQQLATWVLIESSL